MALKGINYGHHLLATAYNPQTVVSELQMLYNNGYRLLRVAYPTYNSSSGTLNMLKDVVVKGLDCGFTVIWGVVGNRPTITSSNYSTFSSYVTGTLAPWAQALNNPKLRLSIGNEEELHVDGTTMTIATLQSNLKSLATSVQSVYTVGEVNYVTDAEQWTLWNTLGLGDIDKIGFNLYYEWQPTGSYATKLAAINTAFTGRYFIGEYSTSNGFADASAFGAGAAEDNWAQNIAQRKTIADSYNLDHCVFCFGDGQFGVTANSWALRKTDGTFRKAWYAHSGSRAYGTKTVSPAGAITISAPSGVNTGDQTLAIAGTSLTISGANGNSVTLPTPSGGTWGSITGTLSSQTDLQTALSAKAASSSLSTVATSGSYTDLINKPTIPTVSDASTTTKGIVQLAGDLAGTATAPTVPGLATKLTGPGSSVSGNIATFNGTTGLTVADSGVSASDLSTSISTLNTGKEPIITAGTSGQYWDGMKTWQTLNKAAVGLASANDTSDANKPVSTAQQAALDLKANISSLAPVATTGSYTDLTDKPTITGATDATSTVKGVIQLTGDLGGTAASPTVPGLAGKAASGANADITSLTGLTTPLATTEGGTGLNAFTSGTFLTASSTSSLASVKTAPAGVVVGTTDTQTLTNKTLTTPTLGSGATVSGATGTPVLTYSKTDATTGSWSEGMSSATTTSLAFIVKPTTNALHTIQNQSGTNILSTDTANSRVGVLQASPTSAFHVQGSLATAVVSKTAAYTATINDSVILCSATTAAFSITLPTAVGCPGREYTIKKTDTSANAVTVATTSSQTIDASTTYALSAQWSFVRVVSDNANWLIIGK